MSSRRSDWRDPARDVAPFTPASNERSDRRGDVRGREVTARRIEIGLDTVGAPRELIERQLDDARVADRQVGPLPAGQCVLGDPERGGEPSLRVAQRAAPGTQRAAVEYVHRPDPRPSSSTSDYTDRTVPGARAGSRW